MKRIIFILVFSVFTQMVNAQDSIQPKKYFQEAKTQLENMLNGKEKPSYEKAIYTIENAWYNNSVDKQNFELAMNYHVQAIQKIINENYNEKDITQKPSLLISQQEIKQQYKQALTNYAIYKYITNTTIFVDSNNFSYHKPFHYSSTDPMASNNWENTQVINLNNTKQGNCFALASLFKIFSDRLNSDANLCIAPSHIYIRHKDNKGTKYNVELGSKNFPGTGMISTITYTTNQAIQNGIAQRELNTQQAVALCLVYLAKGYQHKFNNTSDEFILQCAEIALQYDSKNLNAQLLKAEYLENKLTALNKTISQLQAQTDFKDYQNQIAQLYNEGYREMPLEMKNTILKIYNKQKIKTLSTSPSPNGEGVQRTDEVVSLSFGLFDERHTLKPTERIGNTIFNTKTKKIISFAKDQNLYNNYNFDPVTFAWNIDPLYKKYPNISPYAFCANSPISHFDPDGQDLVYFNMKGQEMGRIASKTEFRTFIQTGNWTISNMIGNKVFSEVPMPKIITAKDNGHGVMTATTGSEYQQYDYNIAAETGIFNYNKNVNGQVPNNSNGNKVDASTVPDLDVNLVKATIMQETTMGTVDVKPNDLNNAFSDIMQANVCYDPSQPYNPKVSDWNDSKKDFGLSLGGGATPQQSIHAGIGIMFRKGLSSSDGKTSTFSTWNAASKKYNGGGAENYGNVLKMMGGAVAPQPSNYTTPTPTKRK